jgi:excisionase family DNA binding protein
MTNSQLEGLVTDQILTVREIAATLRLTERTIYAMLRAGELPGFRVRGQWRMLEGALEAWVTARSAASVPDRSPA